MWYFHFSKLDTFDVSSDTMQNSSASTKKNKIKDFTCVVFKGLKKARKAASLCIMRLPQKHQWGPSLPSCGGSHEQVCFSSLLPRPSGMGGWNHCVGSESLCVHTGSHDCGRCRACGKTPHSSLHNTPCSLTLGEELFLAPGLQGYKLLASSCFPLG